MINHHLAMKPERTPLKKYRAPLPPPTPNISLERDPVQVYCRIRPYESTDSLCVFPVNSKSLKLIPPENSFAFRNGVGKEQTYKFEHVFPAGEGQKNVFDKVAKPLVGDLFAGKNSLLFAYGITGSGKTYTIQGTPQDGGIIRRAVDVVFNSVSDYQAKKYVFKPDKLNGFDIQSEADALLDRQKLDLIPAYKRRCRRREPNSTQSEEAIPDNSKLRIDPDCAYAVFVTYIEMYNNYTYDLLEEFAQNNMTRDLQSKILREDARHNMYVHGCTEIEVKTPQDVMEVFRKGQNRRKVAQTKLNWESSRSHSVFTIRLVQAPLDEYGEEVLSNKNVLTVSQFSIVDLAGSERTNRTGATGERLKESGNINNSLMCLRQCIEILRENQQNGIKRKIPYRDSKITHFFKNYFENEGKVRMVVCVNPLADFYDETLPVMKFADLASEVQISRPIASNMDYGFTPGRRKANQIFKEAKKKVVEVVLPPTPMRVDVLPTSFGELFTFSTFDHDDIQDVISKLIPSLEKSIENSSNVQYSIKAMCNNMMSKAQELEKDCVYQKQAMQSYKNLYEDSQRKLYHLHSQFSEAQSKNDSLVKKLGDYNELSEKYNRICGECDFTKSQGQIDKLRIRARAKAKVELEKEKMKKEMSGKLAEVEEKLRTQFCTNQIKALRDFMSDKREEAIFDIPDTPVITRNAKSDIELNETQSKKNKINQENVGPKHRRSVSYGGSNWIDHNPGKVLVDSGNLLQPNMPRKKSVRQLRSQDLVDGGKPSNYCLTTHSNDSDGQVETKMYKGDVLPTVGGGAQVVFQDVEILRQRDPLQVDSLKRNSDGTPKVDKETLEDRCSLGIMGGGTPFGNKRSRRHYV